MGRFGDFLLKLAIVGYLVMALYYGWSRQAEFGSIPGAILRGAFWPVSLFQEHARQGYVPA